ncbi:hypothetical protein V6N12_043736 [Hibiscus sabdariffa]|uniref:Pentatricopeptide repeat-containing protein n=1 Tax=Hibiscus sabdariffa TaxID=183260 RepID=A0ABR2DGW7_9ROSI
MRRQFRMPNSFTFSSVLTACAALKEAEIECGDMDEAVKTFSWMPTRNKQSSSQHACPERSCIILVLDFWFLLEVHLLQCILNVCGSSLAKRVKSTISSSMHDNFTWTLVEGLICRVSLTGFAFMHSLFFRRMLVDQHDKGNPNITCLCSKISGRVQHDSNGS